MKWHLHLYHELVWHFESKECLGNVCVLHHRVHHLQFYSMLWGCISGFWARVCSIYWEFGIGTRIIWNWPFPCYMEGAFKETIIACLKVLSQSVLGQTKRGHLNSVQRIESLLLSMFTEHLYDTPLYFSFPDIDEWVL